MILDLEADECEYVAPSDSVTFSYMVHQAYFCTIPDCPCQKGRCREYNVLASDPASELDDDSFTSDYALCASEASLSHDGSPEVPDRNTNRRSSDSEPAGGKRKQTHFSDELHPLLRSLLTIISTLQCTSSGAELHSNEHDIHIKIPPGAIPDGETLSIQVGVVSFGPFNFPEGMVPVSPIIWLCIASVPHQRYYQFRRPVEITLPHYLDLSGGFDLQKLCFLKANHTYAGNENGYYDLSQTDGRTVFSRDEARGTLFTDHFCSMCIAEEITEERAANANYCLIMATPESPQQPCWDIYFAVMYFLPTCIEVHLYVF